MAKIPGEYISLAQYAQAHDRDISVVRHHAAAGNFSTAVKIGRNWIVRSDEPYPTVRRERKPRGEDDT